MTPRQLIRQTKWYAEMRKVLDAVSKVDVIVRRLKDVGRHVEIVDMLIGGIINLYMLMA